jgi:Integrase core domain
MELWQPDIVGGIQLADGGEAKVVTGVDDHSRFCVIATVVRTATGRAVCLAFVEALQRFGIPDEVLSDNGKQFTGRFNQPRPAEVMFERICRENGIVARHTKPRSPTTTGKVERFHQTPERELLDDVEVWPDVAAVQAAVDAFRIEYNTNRPHQWLEMAFPADRSRPGLPISGCHCGYRPGCRLPWLNFLRNPLPTPRLRHPKRHRICRLRWWYPATVSTRSTWRSSSPAWCPSPGT